MQKRSRIFKTATVAGACAAIGAVAGIAGAAAAPSGSSHATRHAAQAPAQPGRPFRAFRIEMGGGPAVHADEVILNKAGTAYITATEDTGKVVSVSGDQLTINEEIGNVSYKTVTLTIPSGATVMRNFEKAALTDLKAGDEVHVSQSSDGTFVFADDGTARPWGHDKHGPGGWGGPPPPPPGGPDAQGSAGQSSSTVTSG